MTYNKLVLHTLVYRAIPPFVVAAFVAAVWVYATRTMYSYNLGFGAVFGLSIFPLLGWTAGLGLGFIGMNYLLDRRGMRHWLPRFVVFVVCYVVVVIVVETVGYHVFGVHNLGTQGYSGLVFCNCLHAPVWMQAGYFLLGPVYWGLCSVIMHNSSPVSVQRHGNYR